MNYWQIILVSCIPMLVLAGVIGYFLNQFFEEESARRNFKIKKSYQKDILPQKLNAYERIALFLERIKPSAMAQRIAPAGDIRTYELLFIKHIQSEYEHNLSQQIYIHPDTWKIIYSAKNATQNFIKQVADELGEQATAEDLQKAILIRSGKEPSPSSQAILYLQKDIQGNP